MSKTLVVIDMQTGFHAAHNAFTQYHVAEEIRKARKRKSGIVVVQYENQGDLLRSTRDALKGYYNLDRVWKNSNDGSREIYDSIIGNCFNYETLVVCGVNTEACVCETVFGLSLDMLPHSTIEVVEDACNSDFDNDFSWAKTLNNVILR